MEREKFLSIYNDFRAKNYDVVLMPVSPSGVELMSAKIEEETEQG